jgi:hypothetical protein
VCILSLARHVHSVLLGTFAPSFPTEILPEDTPSNYYAARNNSPPGAVETYMCKFGPFKATRNIVSSASLGRMLGRWMDFRPDAQGAICLPALVRHLHNGDMTSACQSSRECQFSLPECQFPDQNVSSQQECQFATKNVSYRGNVSWLEIAY